MELELAPLNLPSDQERPIVIAGPCSAETEEQVMTTAKQLAAKGCHMFRAGVWKPRTKPGGFEGNGETALPWMKQVKEETGMLTATEVATPEHVELALKYGIDVLWVGARTSANPVFLLCFNSFRIIYKVKVIDKSVCISCNLKHPL